jgi:hypothetical protein
VRMGGLLGARPLRSAAAKAPVGAIAAWLLARRRSRLAVAGRATNLLTRHAQVPFVLGTAVAGDGGDRA